MRRSIRGFTLIELILVMGLLTTFSYMAFQLLSGGLSVWKASEGSRDQEERARAVLDLVRTDLAQLDGSPSSMFVTLYAPPATPRVKRAPGAASAPAENAHELLSPVRVRGVRALGFAEEMRWHAAASAGARAAAEAGSTAAGPSATAIAAAQATARPTLGLLEFAYSVADDPTYDDPAFLTLRRAARPVDTDDPAASFFIDDFFDRDKNGFLAQSNDVVGGLLYFGLEFATGSTQSWTMPASGGGPTAAWDSTRGLYLSPKAAEPNVFPLAVGPGVPARDRVYPRTIRVMLILRREERDQRVVKTVKEFDARAKEIELDDPRPLAVAQGDYIKIGTEWMQVAGAEPRKLRVSTRGMLRTLATGHGAGLEVHRGRIFTLDVPIAVAREAAVR